MSGELDKLNLRLLIILGLSQESAATVMERIGDLERERDELARWKKEALLVESRWDCQMVGKLLGLTLGQDIHPNIEPKIRALLDARHEVETKLNDALVEIERLRAVSDSDSRLLEALGRHVEFQVHDHGFPCFAMIDPNRRREMATPLRVELRYFLEECFSERFD